MKNFSDGYSGGVFMKVWITYYVEDHYGEWFVSKAFNSEEKAKEYIKYRDKMTGDFWDYFEMEVE